VREGDKVLKPPFSGPQRRQFEFGDRREGEEGAEGD
jgi:hypothetical protein